MNKFLLQIGILVVLATLALNSGSAFAYPADQPEVYPNSVVCRAPLAHANASTAQFDIPDQRAEYMILDQVAGCVLAANTHVIPVTGSGINRYREFKELQADSLYK